MDRVELSPKEKLVLDTLEEALYVPKGYYPESYLQNATLKVAIRNAIKILKEIQ